jgi:hypothetical protein
VHHAARAGAISLRFGTPAHGWLEASISGPEGESTVYASDVPGDSLRMLVEAALGLLDGRDGEVVWFLEPAEERWCFTVDGAKVVLSIAPERRPERTIARGLAAEIGVAIWRAMRRLEVDPAWREADIWSHPFPHRELAALGERLGRGGRAR